jgi:hypothetical protein
LRKYERQAHGNFRRSHNAIVALHDGKWEVEKVVQLAEGVQPQISVQELIACEKIVKNSKRVQELAAEVGKGYFPIVSQTIKPTEAF